MIELFEHNKTAYEAALELLKETNRAYYIEYSDLEVPLNFIAPNGIWLWK